MLFFMLKYSKNLLSYYLYFKGMLADKNHPNAPTF
jgi:hypothetical protein